MTLSADYARALHDVVAKDSGKGGEYLKNFRAALRRRGHEKLLPRIFADYETLVIKEERSKKLHAITPEQERTRILLELYRKLVTTHTA